MKHSREHTEEEIQQGFYDRGEWRGKTLFGCLFCPFDSFNSANVVEHTIKVHQFDWVGAQKPKVPMDVPLFDPSGNPLKEREMTQDEIDIAKHSPSRGVFVHGTDDSLD